MMTAFSIFWPLVKSTPPSWVAAPTMEVTEKPRSPLALLAFTMLATPPPELLVVWGRPAPVHMSARAVPSANQLPPGGPAMKRSWSGHPALSTPAAGPAARARVARIRKAKRKDLFIVRSPLSRAAMRAPLPKRPSFLPRDPSPAEEGDRTASICGVAVLVTSG